MTCPDPSVPLRCRGFRWRTAPLPWHCPCHFKNEETSHQNSFRGCSGASGEVAQRLRDITFALNQAPVLPQVAGQAPGRERRVGSPGPPRRGGPSHPRASAWLHAPSASLSYKRNSVLQASYSCSQSSYFILYVFFFFHCSLPSSRRDQSWGATFEVQGDQRRGDPEGMLCERFFFCPLNT